MGADPSPPRIGAGSGSGCAFLPPSGRITMRRRRRSRFLTGLALVAAAAIGVIGFGNRSSTASEPAPPAVLERIAAKNDDAAVAAAARMKVRSETLSAAADARQQAVEAGVDVPSSTD